MEIWTSEEYLTVSAGVLGLLKVSLITVDQLKSYSTKVTFFCLSVHAVTYEREVTGSHSTHDRKFSSLASLDLGR